MGPTSHTPSPRPWSLVRPAPPSPVAPPPSSRTRWSRSLCSLLKGIRKIHYTLSTGWSRAPYTSPEGGNDKGHICVHFLLTKYYPTPHSWKNCQTKQIHQYNITLKKSEIRTRFWISAMNPCSKSALQQQQVTTRWELALQYIYLCVLQYISIRWTGEDAIDASQGQNRRVLNLKRARYD